jgi:hypothetical protein
MTQFGDEHWEILMVASDGEVSMSQVSNVTAGDGSSIDNFQNAFVLEWGQRQEVLAREIFVYKCVASCSTVYKCVGFDHLITNFQGAFDYQVVSF